MTGGLQFRRQECRVNGLQLRQPDSRGVDGVDRAARRDRAAAVRAIYRRPDGTVPTRLPGRLARKKWRVKVFASRAAAVAGGRYRR